MLVRLSIVIDTYLFKNYKLEGLIGGISVDGGEKLGGESLVDNGGVEGNRFCGVDEVCVSPVFFFFLFL